MRASGWKRGEVTMSETGDHRSDESQRKDVPRARGAWARELLRQVFSDESLIPAGRYCAYNAFLGLIVLGFAIAFSVDPPPGHDTRVVLALPGVVGLCLLAGIPVTLLRPGAALRLLAVHGALIVLLTVWFLGTSVRSTFGSPATSFRYFPGLVLLGFSYGMLQVAQFGPWPRQARMLRLAGFVVGVAGEVGFAVVAILVFRRLR
jgi:hypothetical protein